MKLRAAILTSLLVAVAAPSLAQDSEPMDEVIAKGTRQTDPAMTAFLSGDYETAEIEFERNAFCALRVERNFVAGVEGARDSAIRSNAGLDAVGQPNPSGGPGGGPVAVPTGSLEAPTISLNSSDFRNKESETTRTCEDRGYQIYMMGLSQMKLGKREEAKKTFERATKIHRTLFDAHFRLSLMEYQDGDLEKAKKRFKSLKKIASRCKRCAAKEEIEAQVAYLKTLLKAG